MGRTGENSGRRARWMTCGGNGNVVRMGVDVAFWCGSFGLTAEKLLVNGVSNG